MLSSTGSLLVSPGTAVISGNGSPCVDAAGLSRERSSRRCRAMLLKVTWRLSDRIRTPLLTTKPLAHMSGDRLRQGMLDTNIMILRRWIDPNQLPDEMAISSITLAELSAAPHEVRRHSEQDMYDEHA